MGDLEKYIEKRLVENLISQSNDSMSKGEDYKSVKLDLEKKHGKAIAKKVLKNCDKSLLKKAKNVDVEYGVTVDETDYVNDEAQKEIDGKDEIRFETKEHQEKKKKALKERMKENKKVIIVIGMVIFFLLSISVSYIMHMPEEGNGSCPYVELHDVHKINRMYVNNDFRLPYIEMEELTGAYFGKDDCTVTSSKTVKKLRGIELN